MIASVESSHAAEVRVLVNVNGIPYEGTLQRSVPEDALTDNEFAAKALASLRNIPNGAGRVLTVRRWQRHMTQKTLALMVGVHPSPISGMERGSRTIGPRMAQRLARVLGCGWRDMVSG